MGTGVNRFLWTALLLLPVLGLSEALQASWTPGNYGDTKEDALKFLDDYNSTAEEVLFSSVSASWNYNTNITDHNSELQVGQLLGFLSLEGDLLAEPFSHSMKLACLDQFLSVLAPPHHKSMRGQGFLWS